ncbi:hypothetical protein M441DRAFT_60644 [Trichoderma asperellum CBS 433.97]|uniref:Uncharacterized protein n=1 Tax=Trichoderma asperellum (strain ATCC 204424 / CBS 433.97 / NBRC 101777) TaxID=1042311 RepID=A0A2T3Z0T5_TRIA4|nr:hypothetical protein M441DRAFT_60644 [Trichoderma asperellum CBS 433.97]PTB38421.1 hypothetical protein M441DRAFT_60644 [Trichoderma asperellum CBS 433.97]
MKVASGLGFTKALCYGSCILSSNVFAIQFETAGSWDAPAFVPSPLVPEKLNG